MSDTTFGTYLADHPRAIGALFLLVLVAAQTGPAAAGVAVNFGP